MAEMGNIQWFPGHMTKTRRMIQSNLSLVDGVVEILDARVPESSRNPEMDRLVKDKPRMFILNKADMADDNATAKWINHYKSKGFTVIKCNCKNGDGIKGFLPAVRNQLLKELMDKRRAKGIEGAPLRLMIVGIPNVGKSSFINRMAKSKKAKVEDRPGVTRTKQWVKLGDNVEMLDMPGVLWPKFEDQEVARKLAFTSKPLLLFFLKIFRHYIRRLLKNDIKLILREQALNCWKTWEEKGVCWFPAEKLILKEQQLLFWTNSEAASLADLLSNFRRRCSNGRFMGI